MIRSKGRGAAAGEDRAIYTLRGEKGESRDRLGPQAGGRNEHFVQSARKRAGRKDRRDALLHVGGEREKKEPKPNDREDGKKGDGTLVAAGGNAAGSKVPYCSVGEKKKKKFSLIASGGAHRPSFEKREKGERHLGEMNIDGMRSERASAVIRKERAASLRRGKPTRWCFLPQAGRREKRSRPYPESHRASISTISSEREERNEAAQEKKRSVFH